MPSNGPLKTPYDNPLIATPSPGEATAKGSGVTLNEGSASGLQGTPFEKPLVATPSQAPTGNSSEIPNTWTTTGGIPDAPAEGSTAEVAGKVATPNTPAGNMVGGKDLASNIGIGKS